MVIDGVGERSEVLSLRGKEKNLILCSWKSVVEVVHVWLDRAMVFGEAVE